MAIFFPSSSLRGQNQELGKLLDFRPVFRNRSAVAYSIGYGVHTFEMSALRNWVVAFLTFVASYQGTKGVVELLSPAAVATLMGLVGVLDSVSGNEMARRIGRQRWIILVMGAGMVVSAVIGFSSAISYQIAVGLVLIYGALIWADSASLTAGAAGSAAVGQRGATLAVHSTLGYTGGFIGPLSIGIMLDIFGSDAPIGWGLAFLASIGILAIGPLAIIIFKPKSLAGDR